MSWISNIFKKLGGFLNTSAGSSVLGIGSSLLGGLFTSNQNRKLMREQNEFNASQADINRQFQSKEAEIARDWQESFYQQYQSPQAMVHQYEQAGINPVLAAGHATNTPPAATSSSGSMAQGVSPGYQSVAGIMEQFGKLALLKAEINNINADTKQKVQNVLESISREDLNRAYQSLTTEQINDVIQSANLKAAQASTESSKKEWYIVEKGFKLAHLKQINLQNALSESFKDFTGVEAPYDMISNLLSKSVEILGELPQLFFKFAKGKNKTKVPIGGK